MPSATQQRHWFADTANAGWTCDPPAELAIEFHRTLPGYGPTPLVELPELAAELGVGRLFVKDESGRFDLKAFKFLGASWAVHRGLAAYPGTRELTCATDGNHGRAVARMARQVGMRAVIFVGRAVPDLVIDRVRAEGAIVTVLDADYDGAIDASRAYADTHPGALVVQDTSWEGYEDVPSWIVEGYSTMFVEVDEQLRQLDIEAPSLVAVPVGVGSLAQAAVAHYRSSALGQPSRVLSVEPDTAACVLSSLREGWMHGVETGSTVMNGLNCGTPSVLAWPYLEGGLSAAVAVTDAECRAAIDRLAAQGVESGPSGAASYAGLRAALLGDGAEQRRTDIGITADAVVICLSTEGPIR